MVILEEVEYLHYVGEVKRKKVNLLTKKLVIGRIGIVVKTNNFFLVTGMPTCHSDEAK
ncbi:hypothetical protein O3639_03315 [Streptococcus mitis]|uniref:hypothetical protein n=1 Tax=Streptococcus mitis TaxID=28037 RepID=UPI001885848D|nr:hypothetical protein [Streptococcus mitis]MDU3894820.1 hypothetical protein [Streptococcus salivarius]MDU6724636.1 hypothetical protein [Streptococcus mitis]